MTAVTTNMIAVPGAAVRLQEPHDQSVFVAVIFTVGALVGMGGSLFATRAMAPPQMRKSLKEPLLMARADGLDGTDLATVPRPTVA